MAKCNVCDDERAFLRSNLRPGYETLGNEVSVVDLFSGCGGLSLGFAEAARRIKRGTDVKLAIDFDQRAASTFTLNFPKSSVLTCSVDDVFDGALGTAQTEREKRAKRETGNGIDLLLGGPPCQGHSDLNNHTRRKDPRNAFYARMARAAEVLKPQIVVIENVPAVRRDKNGVVDVTRNALVDVGYSCADGIVDFVSIGAPQQRRRHVLLAFDRRTKADPSQHLQELADQRQCSCRRDVRWAIEDLRKGGRSPLDQPARPTPENERRMRWLLDNDVHDLPNAQRPVCHQGEHSYQAMYGRLWWDRPAQTITTGFGSMGQGRYVHPLLPRTITPHEAARLQTFPDFFDFGETNGRGAWARMIGNAVPPVLGVTLGQSVLPLLHSADR